jgi:hypothetical protein
MSGQSMYTAGSVTLFVINFSQNLSKTLLLPVDWASQPIDVYQLTAPSQNVLSKVVDLNGQTLKMINPTTLPKLAPKILPAKQAVIVPSLSFSFFVFPHANATACQ